MPEISRFFGIVIEWAAMHIDELRADWEFARAKQPLSKIDPLG